MKVVRQTNINYLFNKPKTTYILKRMLSCFLKLKEKKSKKQNSYLFVKYKTQ